VYSPLTWCPAILLLLLLLLLTLVVHTEVTETSRSFLALQSAKFHVGI
jgi:hypothetical protein